MTETTNLKLPFIEAAQAQKHVTHNEALRILDAVIHLAVIDERAVPPAVPQEGDRHIVAAGAEDAWAGHDHELAAFEDGAWRFVVPCAGWCAWSAADDAQLVFTGATWRGLRALDNVPQLGVNTEADAGNLLAVKSNAALIAAIAEADGGTGDVRLQLSKESEAGTASVFFSDGYVGRAEFGLIGGNVFRLKVSPDGAVWRDALSVDPQSGVAAMPLDALAHGGLQINGAMEISQQHGEVAMTLAASSALQSVYTVDGVKAVYRGSFVAVAQQATSPFPGTIKALRIGVTAAQPTLGADDELSVVLPIEGVRAARLGFGTPDAAPLSLGFWFSAHRPGSYSGAIRNGAQDRSFPFTFTVSEADTRQWISLSGVNAISGDVAGSWAKDTGLGLTVTLCLAGGASRLGAAGAWGAADRSGASGTTNGVTATSDEFYIGNVIVLPGLYLPTRERAAFALRTADTELAACQRYYWKNVSVTGGETLAILQCYSATQAFGYMFDHPVTMRAAPSIATSAPGDFQLFTATGTGITVTAMG
ncbi:MAG: DUF2793 domain-containing protein, partial [Xanthobacteraceae bacterium]